MRATIDRNASKHIGEGRTGLACWGERAMTTATTDMPKTYYGKLRENLVRLRDERGWSQSELSRRSKVGQSTISRIESGGHGDSEWATIEALARALGVEPGALAGSTPPAAQAPTPTVGRIPIGTLLPVYIASDWYELDRPTHEEMRWLAGLGMITWTGSPPTAGTVHVILDEYRKGNLP